MASPRLITSISEMQAAVRELQRAGKKVGLVPTMGALHEGHLSLVGRAKSECDAAVATIFVNPTQFAPHEDFSKYPRTLDADVQLLASANCDLVFVPSREAMYPPNASTFIEPPQVAQPLEGVFRPGHFRGVATIVLKLFNIIPADRAYFGQKDFQQALVIRRMVADLNVPVQIVVCPIIREPDGLAMSSRNRYLSPSERQQALALSRALNLVQEQFSRGVRDAIALKERMQDVLERAGIERVDYATIADPETLAEMTQLENPAVVLIAAFVGTTRLIDNCLLPGLDGRLPMTQG
ncbi:MAG: pantoate--beta-alanine ligase [Planctomycetales bacterium]|nr:pantoate--beta-alanine ligase [Planctomycetales bacterium]